MISLLIYALLLLLVFGVIFYVIDLLPLPGNFGLIAKIIVGLVLLIILINLVLGLPGIGTGVGPPLLR
jgi:hypothetical protein